jgi:hypothetical protein
VGHDAQTVNAVNLPVMNAMNFPAAILQPPYFDPETSGGDGLRRDGRDIGHGSATASTTRARSSTPPETPQLVETGRLRALQGASQQLAQSNTISTGRFRISRSTVSRC